MTTYNHFEQREHGKQSVFIGEDAQSGQLSRFVGRLVRRPSTSTIYVVAYRGATALERAQLLKMAHAWVAGKRFPAWDGMWQRSKAADGTWRYGITVGMFIDVEDEFSQITQRLGLTAPLADV